MRINIVVKTGWILERLARELVARIPNVRMNAAGWPPTRPTDDDATYFLPMKDVRHLPNVTGIRIGYFTHGEDRARVYHDQFDVHLAMNQQMARCLTALGVKTVHVIRPGTDVPERPIVFGVCGRVYGKGRKGAFLVEAAVKSGYQFVACTEPQRGAVAPCRITHTIEQRADFYRSIDYLVVTSLEEGGPMPVLEAIAHGVPVIAPDVGWCWEMPVIRYERGSWDSLRAVLHGLTRPPTWDDWAEGHRRLFSELEARK